MLFGVQGSLRGCGWVRCLPVQGSWLGGTPHPSPPCCGETGQDGGSKPPLFGSHQTGKDGMAMSPQQTLVPCGVRVGDEKEITAPKPLSLLCRPPGCAVEGGLCSSRFGW